MGPPNVVNSTSLKCGGVWTHRPIPIHIKAQCESAFNHAVEILLLTQFYVHQKLATCRPSHNSAANVKHKRTRTAYFSQIRYDEQFNHWNSMTLGNTMTQIEHYNAHTNSVINHRHAHNNNYDDLSLHKFTGVSRTVQHIFT